MSATVPPEPAGQPDRGRRRADAARIGNRLESARTGERYTFLDDAPPGATGVVVRVWDRLLQRISAMKILKSEAIEGEASEVMKRFLREARVTARLAHPGVVPIHDLEQGEDGCLSFTMAWIEGRTLEDVFELVHAKDRDWSPGRALQAVLKVCEVVSYAHSRGVIHRDLKPANIMVGRFGEVYVVDWGLAKVLPDSSLTESPPQAEVDPDLRSLDEWISASTTLSGSIFGTPAYMPPEQAAGRIEETSVLSDVYSIGAILYHLLTGRPPFTTRRRTPDARTTIELLRRGPPTPVERIAPRTPPELAAVCAKAMARSPGERYQSVEALSEDLRAFTEGRVVEAFERGFLAELRKLVLRNRRLAAASLSLGLVIVGSLAGLAWIRFRTNQHLEVRNEALRVARQEAVDHAREARRMALEAGQREESERRGRYRSQLTAASLANEAGDASAARRWLRSLPTALRGWEAEHLTQRIEGSVASRTRPTEGTAPAPVLALGARPGAEWAAIFGDGALQVLDAAVAELRDETIDSGLVPRLAAISPDGRSAAVVGADARLTFRDLQAGESAAALDLEEPPTAVGFAADGRSVLVGSASGLLSVASPDGRIEELARCERSIRALSAAGPHIAVGMDGGDVLVVSAESGRELRRFERGGRELGALTLGRDGTELAVGDGAGSVHVWSVATGDLLDVSPRHRARVTALSFDRLRDGYVSASRDGTLVSVRGDARFVYAGHTEPIVALCVLDQGTRYLTGSSDGSLRVWDARGPAATTLLDTRGLRWTSGRFSGDGRSLLLGAAEGQLLRFDAGSARATGAWTCGPVSGLAYLDDAHVLAGTLEGDLLLLDLAGSAPPVVFGSEGVPAHRVDARGARAASGSMEGTIHVWSRASSRVERVLRPMAGPVLALSLDAEGRSLVSGHGDGSVHLWDLEQGGERTLEPPSERGMGALALQLSGGAVAYGDEQGRIVVRQLDHGRSPASRFGDAAIDALAWAPDGSRLAAASDDGAVRIFDPELEELLLVERRAADTVSDLTFDPHGTRLLVVWTEGDACIYETGGALQRLELYEADLEQQAPESAVPGEVPEPDAEVAAAGGERSAKASGADDSATVRALRRERLQRAYRLRHAAWKLLVPTDAPSDDRQKALEYAREAASLVPDDAWVEAALGAALLRNGRGEQAVRVLRECAPSLGGTRQTATLALLGIALCRLAPSDEAQALWARLPDTDADADTAALLEELRGCMERGEQRP